MDIYSDRSERRYIIRLVKGMDYILRWVTIGLYTVRGTRDVIYRAIGERSDIYTDGWEMVYIKRWL